MSTAQYNMSGKAVTAIEATVDDLAPDERVMVLYLIDAFTNGPVGFREADQNIHDAQPDLIRERVAANVEGP